MTINGGAGGGTGEITGNLPSGDYTNSIAVDWRPATPVLYVATARGVYQSADLGAHWSLFGEALPNSPVTDLQINTSLNVLAAATYGRGVWEIELGAVNSVWTGSSGSNANWMTANNWAGSSVPVAGDNLIFPAGAAQETNANNLTANTLFGNIVFGAGGYSVSGNSIELNGTIDGSASPGNTTFNIPLTLEGDSSVLMGGTGSLITFGQTINTNGFTLTVGGGAGQASFTSNLSGSGGLDVDIGAGTVKLSGTNSYSGGTAVTGGELMVTAPSALASGSNLFVGWGVVAAFNPTFGTIQPATASAGAAASPAKSVSAAPVVPAPPAASAGKPNPALADAALLQLADRQAIAARILHRSAGDLAWLAAAVNSSWPDLQDQRRGLFVAARDAVLAAYGA